MGDSPPVGAAWRKVTGALCSRGIVEASTGIEPVYTDLQSAA